MDRSSHHTIPASRFALPSVSDHLTYDLGEHILETSNQGIELSNQSVALYLNIDEAYKLFLALQVLFPVA